MRDTGLLRRWSTRDWLSVAVVAATTAFLIGTALLLLSAGAYTATLEGDLSSTATATYTEAPSNTEIPADGIIVSLAPVTVEGQNTRLVAVPPDAPAVVDGASVAWKQARLPHATSETVRGPVRVQRTVRLDGTDATLDRQVRPYANASVFPDRWYAADTETARELGVDGAFVIDSGGGTSQGYREGVPLVAAIPYLLLGIRDILGVLTVGGLGGAVVVAVVVYNITRMTIRDRRLTIRVMRATGADPIRVGAAVVGRSGLIAGTGVLAGTAIGVVTPTVLVAGARILGIPVSLPTAITVEQLRVVAAADAGLVIAGLLAGVVAAVPVVRTPPAQLVDHEGRPRQKQATRDQGSDLGPIQALAQRVAPTLIPWRTAIPTAATLSVFVLIVLLVGGLVGAVAPLSATSTGTITEAGAAHPLNSRIDADYARALRSQGVAASPEILAAQVYDGQPYLLRGADYASFAAVSDATLLRGRPPAGPGEAVIGADLAQTLGVARGDSVTLGGSVSPLLDRVTIVGVYTAPGIVDDQLVVPRETIAPAATGGEDNVHIIRTDASAGEVGNGVNTSGVIVTQLSAPESVQTNESARIVVSVANVGDERATRDVSIQIGNRTVERSVTMAADERTKLTVTERRETGGSYVVAAGPFERTVQVTSPTTLTLPPEFPREAPPGATLLVPATTANGTTVSTATVRFDSAPVPTSSEGVATVPLPDEPGTYPLVVSAPGYTDARTTIEVTPNASIEVGARIRVEPSVGTPETRPNVTVLVANPWGQTLQRNLTLLTPTGTNERAVTLRPGNVSQIALNESESGVDGSIEPGTYQFRLLADGSLVASARYKVQGQATGSALPSDGSYSSGTGIGTAITRVFGNVQVLFAGMVLLAAVSTISGTVATFARAVHARRRTVAIYRATGAGPRRVLSVLIRDAAVIAIPAALAAIVTAWVFATIAAQLDLLVAFGVRIEPTLSPAVLAVALAGSVALAVTGVCVASVPALRAPPAQLFGGE
ncbi:FtsX-like permease family protein [Halobaculum limi]|uniref:FtsX-like permease family protein n=1 Tax=Halobaculum limi TaxID=3031916 RepID=UPI002406225E|nr:FtsX-like permease family protein [Halobaculum sp. YSMS11]